MLPRALALCSPPSGPIPAPLSSALVILRLESLLDLPRLKIDLHFLAFKEPFLLRKIREFRKSLPGRPIPF